MKKIPLLSTLFKEESGIAKIIVAFCILVAVGFTAIAVDAGGLYFEKSRLQKSLDAAVLGGAQKLLVSEDKAKEVAIELAAQNGFSVSIDEVATGENFIEIGKTVNKKLTFAPILGFTNTDIHAFARAEIQATLIKGTGVIPVGIEKGDYQKGALYALNEKPGHGTSGNYHFLGIDGRGANILGEGIKKGSKTPVVVGDLVETESGMNWGKVEEGFKYRINEDVTKPYCSTYETADYSCHRVVILPVIETFKDAKGRSLVEVVGFAAYWIESITKHEAKGQFIEIVAGGTFGAGEEFGIYGVKLVK